MNHYIVALLIGLGCYMGFAFWCIYSISRWHTMRTGCLDLTLLLIFGASAPLVSVLYRLVSTVTEYLVE